MSKSRNSRKYDYFYYEDEFKKITRKDLVKHQNKRREKKLNSALKSKNLNIFYDWKD